MADDRFHGVLFPYTGPAHRVAGTENVVSDETFPEAATVAGVQRTVYDEAEPRGAEHDRQAYLVSGDVLAVVLQSRKGAAHAVPFRQTVVLRASCWAEPRRDAAPRTTGAAPRRVSWGPAPCNPRIPLKEHPVIVFFEILLVLVCVGVLAFAGLTVKKLFQGQR